MRVFIKLSRKYIFNNQEKIHKKVANDIHITNVTSIKDLETFHKIAWTVYKDDIYWVPPLWQELKTFFKTKNFFWNHAETQLFIAYKNSKPIGRIAGIIDHALNQSDHDEQSIGYFGFFECINEYGIAKNLFDIVKKYLKEKNITIMRGPVDGRIDIRCGFLLNGYTQIPSIFSSYNPAYYIEFINRYTMKKARDQYVYWLDLQKPIPTYLKDAADFCIKEGFTIRGFNKLHGKKEMDWWISFMQKAFSFHWGYVTVSEDEVRNRFGVKYARLIADTKLFLIVESPNGERIAFKWSTPDYNQVLKKLNGNMGVKGIIKFLLNQKSITKGRFNFVGIKKEYRGKKLGSAMNYWTMLEMKKRGYTGAECGWIDEKNIASQKTIEKTGATLYKKYRVYEIPTS